MSFSDPISAISAILSIIEKAKKLFKKPEETIATRFVQLFEKHGVHRNQIPRFFGHALTVKKVATDKKLLSYLTEGMLCDAAELFAIRREWLDGVDDQIYPVHYFYKEPDSFVEFCKHLKTKSDARIRGILFFSENKKHGSDALILLEEHVGDVGDTSIYRYHILGGWIFSYWKCRAYMAACIAIASKQGIHIHGRKLPYEKLKGYLEGCQFLGNHYDGLTNLSTLDHREDMTFSLEVFFKGLEGKLYENEYEQAISLWEKLVGQGYMDDGISHSVLKDQTNNKLFKEKYLTAIEKEKL